MKKGLISTILILAKSSMLALIALLSSTPANACTQAQPSFFIKSVSDSPHYVGESFRMEVSQPSSWDWLTPSGFEELGYAFGADTVGKLPTEPGLHRLRALWQNDVCAHERTVYALPSLGAISVTGTLWTFNDLDFSVPSSGGAPPLSYTWDFNDGTTKIGQSVTHRFESAGTYQVSVEVAAGGGKTDTETKTIVVTDNPNIPGMPGPIYESFMACIGGSPLHDISWSAPATGATANTYRLTITKGGHSVNYWNSTTFRNSWLTPSTHHVVEVRGCTSQSLSTCGPTRSTFFWTPSNPCSGGGGGPPD